MFYGVCGCDSTDAKGGTDRPQLYTFITHVTPCNVSVVLFLQVIDPPAGLRLSGLAARSTDHQRDLAIAQWRKHSKMADLKGGGQLAAKVGNGKQMRGMVPGLGSVSGCPRRRFC
jgi:hypothetical protein